MSENLNAFYHSIGEDVYNYGWVTFIESDGDRNRLKFNIALNHSVKLRGGVIYQIIVGDIPRGYIEELDKSKEYILEYSLKMADKFGGVAKSREVVVKSSSYQLLERKDGHYDILIPLYDSQGNGMEYYVLIERERVENNGEIYN